MDRTYQNKKWDESKKREDSRNKKRKKIKKDYEGRKEEFFMAKEWKGEKRNKIQQKLRNSKKCHEEWIKEEKETSDNISWKKTGNDTFQIYFKPQMGFYPAAVSLRQNSTQIYKSHKQYTYHKYTYSTKWHH
jgi:hypothetical protein